MRENQSANRGTAIVAGFVGVMAVVLGLALWQADSTAARRRQLEDNPAVVLKIGSKLPQFKLVTQDRASFSLRDMCRSRKAKALLLHFFSLENQNYDREFSHVAELDKRYGSRGLYTIYINTDMTPRREMMVFAKAKALSSPLLLDMYSKTLFSYGFEQAPATVLADRNCRAVQVFTHRMPLGQRANEALRWTLDMGPSPFTVAKNNPQSVKMPTPPDTSQRPVYRPGPKPEPFAKDAPPKRRAKDIRLPTPSILKKNARVQTKAPAKAASQNAAKAGSKTK